MLYTLFFIPTDSALKFILCLRIDNDKHLRIEMQCRKQCFDGLSVPNVRWYLQSLQLLCKQIWKMLTMKNYDETKVMEYSSLTGILNAVALSDSVYTFDLDALSDCIDSEHKV